MTFDNQLSKFKIATQHGNHVQAYCPAHNDKHASLSITVDGERMLVFCHAGCSIDSILAETKLTLKDLFAGDRSPPVSLYQYRKADGSLSHEKLKYQTARGKTFKQRRLDGDKISDDLEGLTRIPYNLPALQQGIKQGSPIIYCEGEKDADIAALLGFTGTTLGGASDWRDEYKVHFKGANVVLVPDKDAAGLTHISKVQKSLMDVCKSLKCMVLPEGKDLSEWVERGHKNFSELIQAAPDLVTLKSIPEPQVQIKLNSFMFSWNGLGLKVIVDRIRNDEEGEISVIENDKPLYVSGIKLLSVSHKTALARALKTQRNLDWDRILNQVATICLTELRKADPLTEIWPGEDNNLEAEYLLKPLLYLNHPTVIFGDYGSLKSLFALIVAYILQMPYRDNPCGLNPLDEPVRCLYLDYEDDLTSFRKRWSAIEVGMGQGGSSILHRRMTTSLADSVDQIQMIVEDNDTKLLIVDSLGPAARGNLNDTEPAIRYHSALRKIGITSLTLAHTAKDQLTKHRSVFGSVFFTNLSRSVWECRAEQEVGEDEAVIALKQIKANLSRLHPPLGFRFKFDDDSIRVFNTDLRDTTLSSELPLSWQIKGLLRRGFVALNDIATELEAKEDTVSRTLRKMRSKNEVIKLDDGSWGLSR